jgi:hypothetical protein
MVIRLSQFSSELTKKFLLVVIAVFICSKLNAQCNLNIDNVQHCSTSGAVLGLDMQLLIAGIPSNLAITDYSWTGPSGFTSTLANPYLPSPVADGFYTLTVQTLLCGSVSQTITVSSVTTNCPSVAFAPSQTTICDLGTINFNNQSAGSNTYYWFFGDGSTSSSQSPSHTYNVPTGNTIVPFNVILVSVNATGYMSVISHTVNMVEIPTTPSVVSNQLQTYLGQEYLVSCAENDPSGGIYINGVSTSAGSWVQSYSINWGDGNTITNVPVLPVPCFNNFNQGVYTFQITLNGPSGCTVSNTYPLFVGSTPAVSLGSPGNTEQCGPYTFVFSIDSVQNNTSGTTYTAEFSDGGLTQYFSHPPPSTFSHTFTHNSCGETSLNNLPDAFWVQITAQNPCDIAVSTIEPIRISDPPIASFTALPTPVCINTAVNVNSTADPGTNVNSSGCNTNHGMLWSISPATGWNVTSGSLGTANGQPTNYTAWTSGSTQLSIVFSITGTYVITQRIRNSCGEDVTTRTVCVVPPITAAFNLHYNDQCAPETITTDNLTTPLNTCVQPTYLWSINPSAPFAFNIPPFTSSSFEPAWTLNVDTTYVITLAATNACGTTYDDTSFTIVAPPTVNILPIPPGCAPYIVDPSVTYYDGGGSIVMQEWSIDNGPWILITPSEPVDHLPISFPAGPHTISVRVTNECGTALSTRTFVVTSPPQISLNPFSVCSGVPEIINGIIPPVIIGTGAVPYLYNWSGPGIFPSNISNPTLTLTNTSIPPIASVEVINLIVTDVLGCSDTANVNVTVNPLPTLSALPNSKCIGYPEVPLSVNSDIPGTTFVWTPANSLSSATGSLVQANPSTSTTYTIVGIVTSTGCISSTTVDLTVNPLPIVDAQAPLQLCAQGAPTQILQGVPAGGIWSDPTALTGTFVAPNTYTTSANPGLDTLIYTYTDLNGCTNFDSVQVIILTLEPAVVGSDFSICQNASPQLLNSGVPIGGSWSGTGVILQLGSYYFDPSIAAVGNHTLTYTINAGTSCESNASQAVTVFQIPIVNTGLDLESCSGINATISSNVNLGLQPYQYAWSPSTGVVGPTNTSQLLVEHLNQSGSDQVFTYILTVTDDNSCNVSDEVNLTIHPLPLV